MCVVQAGRAPSLVSGVGVVAGSASSTVRATSRSGPLTAVAELHAIMFRAPAAGGARMLSMAVSTPLPAPLHVPHFLAAVRYRGWGCIVGCVAHAMGALVRSLEQDGELCFVSGAAASSVWAYRVVTTSTPAALQPVARLVRGANATPRAVGAS